MTPAWVSQLVDSIFRWWPESGKLMAIVAEQFLSEAYLDESQTGHGDSRVYTLASLVAPKPRWEEFSTAWSDALKSCGAAGKIVHMRDILHQTKGSGWEGWPEARRRSLFKKLVSVARTYWVFGFCGSIPLRDFEEVYKPSFQEPGGGFRPYELLLQGTMEAIVRMISPAIEIMKKNPLVFFMERNQVVEADATRQFYHLTNGRGWTDIFPSIVPLPKGPEPLQFADMVAYEGSRRASDQIASNPRKPRRLYEECNPSRH